MTEEDFEWYCQKDIEADACTDESFLEEPDDDGPGDGAFFCEEGYYNYRFGS